MSAPLQVDGKQIIKRKRGWDVAMPNLHTPGKSEPNGGTAPGTQPVRASTSARGAMLSFGDSRSLRILDQSTEWTADMTQRTNGDPCERGLPALSSIAFAPEASGTSRTLADSSLVRVGSCQSVEKLP